MSKRNQEPGLHARGVFLDDAMEKNEVRIANIIRNEPAVPANFLPKSGSARIDSHLNNCH
jgi:hypothetical protein